MNRLLKYGIIAFIICIFFTIIFGNFSHGIRSSAETYSYPQFITKVEEANIKQVIFQDNRILGYTKSHQRFVVFLPDNHGELLSKLINNRVEIKSSFNKSKIGHDHVINFLINWFPFFLFLFILTFIPSIFFTLSVRKSLANLSDKELQFSRWLIWLMLLPFIDTIVKWVILPFKIPSSLDHASSRNARIDVSKIRSLKRVGFIYMITKSINTINILSVASILLGYTTFYKMGVGFVILFNLSLVLSLVTFIVYWVKIVKVRRTLVPLT